MTDEELIAALNRQARKQIGCEWLTEAADRLAELAALRPVVEAAVALWKLSARAGWEERSDAEADLMVAVRALPPEWREGGK